MESEEIRKRLNRLDFELIELLNERMELDLRLGKIQDKNLDGECSCDNSRRLRVPVHERLINREFANHFFDGLDQQSRQLQAQNRKLTGFMGVHGANGDVAVRAYDPNMIPIPCMRFIDVFAGVRDGRLDYGLVPVENILEGQVAEVNDLLIQYDLHIAGEVNLPIHHALLTLPETDPLSVKEVYSHQQALAQCRNYLNLRQWEARPFYNTAGAAKMLSETKPKASAVIANKLCADIYHLKVIEENIEDESFNYTRFILLSACENPVPGDKCSLVFSTWHRAGALYQVLRIFAEAGINLLRIESRPSKDDPGNFLFLVDFKGNLSEPAIQKTLDVIRANTVICKLLGSYAEAPASPPLYRKNSES